MKETFWFDATDYDVSYDQLVEWSQVSGIDVWCVHPPNGYSATTYAVNSKEHLTAFKLRFGPKTDSNQNSSGDFFDGVGGKSEYF